MPEKKENYIFEENYTLLCDAYMLLLKSIFSLFPIFLDDI